MSDDFDSAVLNKNIGVGELSPGVTKRRWEPTGGLRKHRERIHRESKFADDNKNLPFEFSGISKQRKPATVECSFCGNVVRASVDTVGMICSRCKKFVSVEVI